MNDRPLNQEEKETINEQMKKCICKIQKEDETATGFFLKINFDNRHILVLMTNCHVLNEEFFKKNKKNNNFIK